MYKNGPRLDFSFFVSQYPEGNYGERLKALRLRKGLKLSELAEMAGVWPETISNWENCKTHPLPYLLSKVTAILEVDDEHILDGEINILASKLGRRLVRYRAENDLSQKDLASYLGVNRDTLSGWELGKGNPNMKNIEKLRCHTII